MKMKKAMYEYLIVFVENINNQFSVGNTVLSFDKEISSKEDIDQAQRLISYKYETNDICPSSVIVNFKLLRKYTKVAD